MRRFEPELPAVDGPLGGHQSRVDFGGVLVRSSRRAAGATRLAGVVDHAELVHQDFLRLASRLQRVGVDDAVERSEQELVGENGKLDGEVPDLVERHLALRKPSGVLVFCHHRVLHEPALDRVLEGAELFSSHGILPSGRISQPFCQFK